jgi:hypothetical protein
VLDLLAGKPEQCGFVGGPRTTRGKNPVKSEEAVWGMK